MKRAGIIFLLFVVLLTGGLRIYSLSNPVDSEDDSDIFVRIESGKSSWDIADKLYEKNLINSTLLFNLWVMIGGYNRDLKAGYYQFSKADSLKEIVNRLVSGEVANYRVTIPEGFNVEDIAGRLAKITGYEQQDFLQEAKKKALLEDKFKKWEKINTDELKYPLEGFLYPETYNIPKDFAPERVLEVFINEFEHRWNLENEIEVEGNEYSIFEIITIASLIEREAKLREEKPLISAVIHNRLNKNMLLQIDASIQYAHGEWKERVLYNDLKIQSPYNTYQNEGLPPGPISNPGDNAIEAALNPEDETEYLFYFALNDGSHVFTRNYRKHLEKQVIMKERGLLYGSE